MNFTFNFKNAIITVAAAYVVMFALMSMTRTREKDMPTPLIKNTHALKN